LYEREILGTIQLAHHFHSAYTRDQIYQFIGVSLERSVFEKRLDRLVANLCLTEVDGRLYMPQAALDLPRRYRERKSCSVRLFNEHRSDLRRLAAIPWIQFMGMTGANSFESCKEADDIDLFVITDRDRLWLTYLVISAATRLMRKRGVLCFNYLIDEDHLQLPTRSYFAAVQMAQMIPIFGSDRKAMLLRANQWVFDFLPNANRQITQRREYSLALYRRQSALPVLDGLCQRLNYSVSHRYRRRLIAKFPQLIGKGVILSHGLAKLHSKDHSALYDLARAPRAVNISF
jgi:hypothetical protein